MPLLAVLAVAASLAAPCRAGQVRLAATFYGEAGGQFGQTIVVTNAGPSPCVLSGWPRLVRRVPSIRVVQQRSPFRRIVVAPGGAASFDVFGADFDAMHNRACPKTDSLFVALPGTSALAVKVAVPDCGPLDVAPFVPGRADRGSWSTVWAKRWCQGSQFDVSVGPRVSEATGQHTLVLRLANRGASCTVFGFPMLSFEDARGRIPFVIRTGTDQMIHATYGLPVVVRHGGSAYVVMNKYRCDAGSKRIASVVRVGFTVSDVVTVRIRNPLRRPNWCGPGDPGSTITEAPFEPSVVAALHS